MISKISCLIFLVTKMGRRIKIRFRIACLFMLGLDLFLDGVLERERWILARKLQARVTRDVREARGSWGIDFF